MRKSIIIALGVAVIVAAAPVGAVSATTSHQNVQDTSNVCQEAGQTVATIPVTSYGSGAVGSEKVLATKNVPNGEYKVHVAAENQGSIHPNTDMVVRSGNNTVVVTDIESVAFKKGTADGTLKVTDGKITVSVKFGKDGVFSGGVTVSLTCAEKPVEPPVTPPVTPPATPETPATPEAPAPTPTPEVPAELPATGAAGVISSVLGFGLIAYFANRLVSDKRRLGRLGR